MLAPRFHKLVQSFQEVRIARALNDLVAGHIDFIFMELSSALKLHEGGKARIPMRLRCFHCQRKAPSQRLLRGWERR